MNLPYRQSPLRLAPPVTLCVQGTKQAFSLPLWDEMHESQRHVLFKMVRRKILSTAFLSPFFGQCSNMVGSGKTGISFARIAEGTI